MLQLSGFWAHELLRQGETGMGYQVVTVLLKDGQRLDQVVIIEGLISQIRGRSDIPFLEEEIQNIIVTHDKWDFNSEA